MARLTRRDSQARTRARLVAHAKIAFLRDGYFATSLERVAEEAGFSKGAVYSNFPAKEALSLAVLDEIRAEQVGRLAAAFAGGPSALEARLAALTTWAEQTLGDEGWSVFELELGSASRRSPVLRAALAERNAQARALVAAVIARGADELGLALPLPVDVLAAAALSLGVGLGLQRAIDASVPAGALADVVRALVGAPARAPVTRDPAARRRPRADRAAPTPNAAAPAPTPNARTTPATRAPTPPAAQARRSPATPRDGTPPAPKPHRRTTARAPESRGPETAPPTGRGRPATARAPAAPRPSTRRRR